MAKKHYGDIELVNGSIINLEAENLSSDPTFDADQEGRIIYNTTSKSYKYNNGSAWVTFEVSATASNALVNTLGSNWINPDLSFDPTDFNSLDNISGLTTDDSLYDVIDSLDTAITEAKAVITLRGVDLEFDPNDLTANNIIYFDGTEFIAGTVNDLDTVDLSFSELEDADFDSLANNEIVVRQDSAWVNKPIFFKFEELSGTLSVFTVNHSLGEQFCHVTVVDMSTGIPQRMSPATINKIEYNSSATLTVTLNANKPVTIIVSTLDMV